MLLLERKADLTPFSNSLIDSCSTFLEAGFFTFWFAITHIFSAILELIHFGRLSDKDGDLEIMILRHQLDVMTRLQAKPIKPNRAEKMTLAVLTKKLRQPTNRSLVSFATLFVSSSLKQSSVGIASWLAYYNHRRPHQGFEQQSPIPRAKPMATGVVNKRQVLGGIINDYFRAPETASISLA